MLSRPAIFRLVLTCCAIVAAAGRMALADRYQNNTDLAPGRFVWSPTVSPTGPLTLVVSRSGKSLHVYRQGAEIGISTIETGDGSAGSGAVFLLTALKRPRNDALGRESLEWRGLELMSGGPAHRTDSDERVHLPSDFAELLFDASHRGAVIIVAEERSDAQSFSAPGPFVDPIETGSVNSRIGRFATPEIKPSVKASETADTQPSMTPANAITSIILSRADLSAYVIRDGRVSDRLPIAVENPTESFGRHAMVLVTPGSEMREAKWLAFGLDDRPDAPHLVKNSAEHALRRVRFLDQRRTRTLSRELKAGTVFTLIDGHGPSATEVPRFDVALLTSERVENKAPVAPSVAPELATRVPAANAPDEQSRRKSPSAGRQAAGSPAKTSAPLRRRRGPREEREPWPNSMYWPY